ncbi:T9SS type A sorting domain-containing protein [Hymenobacter mucosus]|uniref:T9SS type A sorting domain-containing protein n=1 Tax=Hymenobacter mucosus TaxID=1411120 RepID=UPI0015C6445C|nr:T9SS type A sorting domain-containing protein [Hymenobacter mucosus]
MYTAIPDADNSENFVNVDFGFSFDVVTNTNDSGQGSLRQFVINSNALSNTSLDQRPFNNNGTATGTDFPAGQETSIFMISDGTARPGLRAGLPNQLTNASNAAATSGNRRALITLTASLDAITDAGTALDGTTQTTLLDSNTGALGSSGTVGTTNITFRTFSAPEVEVSVPNTNGASAITSSANNIILRGIAVHGGGANFGDATIEATAGTSLLIEGCGIGISAFSLAAPANPTAGVGVYLQNPSGTVRNSIVAECGRSCINYSAGFNVTGSGYTITQNELLQGGRVTAGGDNITVGRADGAPGAAGPVTITENLIRDANSSGIQLEIGSISNNTISNNTITGNGKGGAPTRLEGSGIHYLLRRDPTNNPILSTNSDRITLNVISNNQSSAVVINYGQRNVRVTRNSIYGNGDGTTGGEGLIAVDYTPATYYAGGNPAYGQGDGVTPNDGTTSSEKPNFGMNYPIITKKNVTINGATTTLHMEGFVGRTAGQTAFANTEIEFYRGDNSTDTNQNGEIFAGDGQNFPHGEPRTYLGNTLTGSTGSFSADIVIPSNSISPALLTTDPINALAYKADMGTSEAGINLIPNTIPAGALPVELVRFDARAAGSNALVTWATAMEKNNDHFEVQRSRDGREFVTTGTVKGRGTTQVGYAYSFTDALADATGLYYYRLRQVDTDGTDSYTAVQTVSFIGSTSEASQALRFYPNPTTNTITLDQNALAAGTYQLTVTNLLGGVVATQTITGGRRNTVDLQRLPAGSYLVHVRNNAVQLTQKVVKN